jgi:hypothetical protein
MIIVDFNVGDFIKEQDKYYRILGAFQAVKSFTGKWKKERYKNIQQRGKNKRNFFIYI